MERGGRAGLQPAAGGGGGGGGGGWVLVEARLRGGAPWGFTVQGGLEHNEPLLISKVEEGGKVDRLERPLQVGDEIIAINEVELSGYRQEAIALVKASHKTLQLTVRRDLDPGFIEEFGTSCSSAAPSPPSTPLAAQQPPSPGSPLQSRPAATEEVQLRFKNRRNEPASRPHSWHSSKLGEGQRDVDPDAMDAGGGGWYHPSASTADLSAGFDSGTYLRKSPDQYSSRGSMESLDAPGPSQHHPGAHHQHPLGREAHGGAHPAYSSCHQLCSSRSSNSIDHLHSKRDSAYSSVSTGSSVPEYLAATPTFSPERSCSLEAVPQLQLADVHYARAASDQQQQQQRPAQEHEPSGTTAPLLRHAEPRSRGPGSSGPSRDPQAGGVCYRGNRGGGGVPASNRHSVGPIWGPAISCSSYENLKGAPAPPRRSDSYAALRNHDRPNSWSSLEHARSLRSLQKGSWHHSSGPVASGPAKGSYGPEGPLHTVMEKSPESSPTTRPRQGGGFSQPHSPGGPGPPDLASVAPPTGKQPPLPQAEPHSAPAPNGGWAAASPGVYRKQGEREERRDGGMGATQNGHHLSSSSSTAGAPAPTADSRGEEPSAPAFVTPLLPAPPASATQPHPLRLHGDAAAPWEPDREHPLTRLELALAEVQRGAASQSHVPVRFHDDDGGATEPGRGPAHSPARSPARSLSVLEKVSRFERRERAGKQRSHSTCTSGNSAKAGEKGVTGAEDLRNMLERSNGGARAHRTMSYRGGSGEHARHSRFPADPSLALQRSRSTAQLKEADAWKEDVQEMLDHLQDASSTRSYRDSLKDAQSKVLRSTSFRRRDLTSSIWGPAHVSSNPQPWSQDKKGPKTLPKPQGLFLPPQATASPHTPKERQEVSPGARGPSPPALPSIPPVGPPPRTRICGRRRLGVEQKKRSYSEPDKMNEIGVSDPETAALYRRGGETSVADRRRMFELAASGAANGPLPSSRSRPDLRQAQHDALAEYVVRKKALKREEGSRGPGARPRSVYLPPEGSSHTTSCSLSDVASISSTSSLLSLLETGPDLGRVTTPRPPAHSPPSPSFSCPPGLQDRAHPGPEAEPNRENGSSGGHPLQVQPRRAPAEPQQNPGVSKKLSSALQRAQSIRDSGKSASTEDLLERSEEGRAAPRHQRSRSSPAEGSLSQDLPPAAAATLGAFLPAAANRLADMLASGDQVSQNRLNTAQPERRLQDADPPVPRRERARRSGERQRSSATSTLAASVGLQCPLTPSGIGGGASGDWRASERLSQVNLDAIVFPGVSDGGPSGPPEAEPQSLSVANGPDRSRTPPSPPTTQPEPRCLRISEPGLTGSGDQRLLDADVSQADSDEVFLHDLEDFPPPPPDVDPGAGSQTGGSSPPSSPPSSSPLHSPPGPGLPPDLERQPPGVASKAPPAPALEYQPLPRREKTYEDLRVEALAKQLVWRDSSLAPLLDMFGVKSTMELMEEVFTPNSRLGGKSPWQRRGSRVQDLCDPPEMDPDQTQDEDLNAKKVELCEALRHSVAALQQEREALREEQRHHRALGASIDSLVQERLKANERDKYSVFVGDLERIVNLLLSLCSRLMRIDRALLALERDPLLQEDAAEERDSLLHKRSLVLRQTDDAQELKENLERRQRVVHGILSGYLTPAQLRDYRGFVSAKPSLLIRQRHLDNLIRHREEHLSRLADSLPRELADGGLRGRPFSPPSPTPLPFPPITTPGPAPPVRPTPVTSL